MTKHVEFARVEDLPERFRGKSKGLVAVWVEEVTNPSSYLRELMHDDMAQAYAHKHLGKKGIARLADEMLERAWGESHDSSRRKGKK